MVKSWKKKLFIFPNSLIIHQTSTLHNTFYFNNTWMKIQLRSDPLNMQPDEIKCYPHRPITRLWPAASNKMLSTSSGSPLPNSGTLSLHMERNCRRILECHISHTNLDVLRPIFDVGKARCNGSLNHWNLYKLCSPPIIWWISWTGLKLCTCQMIAG